ncbi:PREDICTED: alsin isoform X2 [Nicrophorus vespilloides]|uniref:Alsin isoform X2 n=1 Tax=Nicrophorus vespilloides TaxID=110193 RepID=A0ABM1MH20_NICVS|nr:PREDICTED: alsin isoform X2 [Nicrophorus vespilloides]
MDNLHIWDGTKKLKLLGNLNETIKKLCNIGNHIYLLTTNNNFYHGYIDEATDEIQLELVESLNLKDIDCCDSVLYAVEVSGKVQTYSESIEHVGEIMLIEESKTCFHGHTGAKCKMKVDKLAVGNYGGLFITENGQLWASGNMHQIGINSTNPKKVSFFDNRFVYNCNVGNDFAIAIVSKQIMNDDTDSDDCEEDIFVSSCPHCLSTSQLTSPISQNSLSDICPLGLPIPVSYDIETTSTSSRNSNSSNETRKCLENDQAATDKVEKNIIFRNTEAAKEFLTRQFSWMSSAGELVECTEKPTRIIKENVTNMASLVYEGVKTVGDKVVTLSRHVSGSSENNETSENVEEMQLPRVTSKDEFMWSLSQGTSEREFSELGIHERCSMLLKTGSNLLNCEVWTWGNILHGQLGVGDIMKRERPMIITKLSNVGAQKVSVQSYHAAILTLDGRAFMWGRNDYHQVTIECNIDQSSPRLFPSEMSQRVKDISCGDYHTTLLTTENDLKYLGKHSKGNIVTLYNNEKGELKLDREDNIMNYILSSKQYIALNTPFNNSFIVDSLVTEQKYLEEMLLVHVNLIKPVQKRNISCADSLQYEQLCRHYMDLLHFTALNIKSLIDYSNKLISECDIVMFKNVEEHLFIYKAYLNTLHSIISLGGCNVISKLIDIPACLYKMAELGNKKDKKCDESNVVYNILMKPMRRMTFYEGFIHLFVKNSSKIRHDTLTKWTLLIEEQQVKHEEAETTKQFWLNSGKVIEQLKTPNRRLVRDSQKFPIFLQNGSRFTSHWFILLTDIFVHMNGSTPNVHDLTTVWVEPQQDSNNSQYQMSLKMPEESIELYTTTAEQKIEWFHALQNAIKLALVKPNAHQPPCLRSANYTFVKNGIYKDAKYSGRWLNGKMHGSGKLEWPDGRIYKGQFSNNQMHGFGRLEEPNKGNYEGYWKDNQQNGFGIFKYTNGDLYKGYFKDGLSHGHGFFQQGHFMATAASIYIGDWVFGNRNGYGIMDDIVTGEKYLGNWNDNKKHGNGLIVTSEGIYYEGIFNQDVLTGHGVMILEDGTHYEGDFKGTGILSGKGVLTLKSGHTIEGNLTGPWNEGIKISNAVLSLTKTVHPDVEVIPKTFGTFCTPVENKWKSLFRQCHQLLGIPETTVKNNVKIPDIQKIWQNVAVIISNTHQGISKKKKFETFENSLNNLDTIPEFGKDTFDEQSHSELKLYLTKAFECSYHPLGSLLSDITKAYTTAYGTRAHPLLLQHAVTELHSITKRLYDIVKLLFPALPCYGKEIVLGENDVISCQALLYPIILPKVHLSLFTLYTLRNKQQDAQYWKRLLEWNKQPDYTLMVFLHVDSKFLKSDHPKSPTSIVKDQTFTEAVEMLQQLKTTFSPMEKLLVIKETFQKMTKVVQEQLGENYRWNMDDLLPVLLYVVVRARILQLGSELDFVEDFMEPSLESGELGIMFTTLKACYQQILQEKLTIN